MGLGVLADSAGEFKSTNKAMEASNPRAARVLRNLQAAAADLTNMVGCPAQALSPCPRSAAVNMRHCKMHLS